MLPSKGHFRFDPCSSYLKNNCEKPHCHFRHIKKDQQLLKKHKNIYKDGIAHISEKLNIDSSRITELVHETHTFGESLEKFVVECSEMERIKKKKEEEELQKKQAESNGNDYDDGIEENERIMQIFSERLMEEEDQANIRVELKDFSRKFLAKWKELVMTLVTKFFCYSHKNKCSNAKCMYKNLVLYLADELAVSESEGKLMKEFDGDNRSCICGKSFDLSEIIRRGESAFAANSNRVKEEKSEADTNEKKRSRKRGNDDGKKEIVREVVEDKAKRKSQHRDVVSNYHTIDEGFECLSKNQRENLSTIKRKEFEGKEEESVEGASKRRNVHAETSFTQKKVSNEEISRDLQLSSSDEGEDFTLTKPKKVRISHAKSLHYCPPKMFQKNKKGYIPPHKQVERRQNAIAVAAESKKIAKFRPITTRPYEFQQVKSESGMTSGESYAAVAALYCDNMAPGTSRIYVRMKKFLLNEDELDVNGYPRMVEGCIATVSKNASYYRDISLKMTNEQGKDKYKCVKCSTWFSVDINGIPEGGNCSFHLRTYGYITRGWIRRYGCCPDSDKPCVTLKYHILDKTDETAMGGFVETVKAPPNEQKMARKVYAVDCEMVYTTEGMELARLTIVGEDSKIVQDIYVIPAGKTVVFYTMISGISEGDLDPNVPHTYELVSFEEARNRFMRFVYKETILIGHSLENDLKCLKIVHRNIVDTSVVYNNKTDMKRKPSLKYLAWVHLSKSIQTSESGHDSTEDAVTCLELMYKKISNKGK